MSEVSLPDSLQILPESLQILLETLQILPESLQILPDSLQILPDSLEILLDLVTIYLILVHGVDDESVVVGEFAATLVGREQKRRNDGVRVHFLVLHLQKKKLFINLEDKAEDLLLF